MQRKKMTLRFDLDCPEDKRAWEYLQSLNGTSMNRTVLAIINQTEQLNRIQEIIRSTIQEELSTILKEFAFQPAPETSACEDGVDDTILGFLENFT